mgnify:CR=1 FL=1
MIIELNKHRPGTPESVMDDIYSLVNTGEVESIFCLFRLKDGEIACTWSQQDQLALLGLLEIAKVEVIAQAIEVESR